MRFGSGFVGWMGYSVMCVWGISCFFLGDRCMVRWIEMWGILFFRVVFSILNWKMRGRRRNLSIFGFDILGIAGGARKGEKLFRGCWEEGGREVSLVLVIFF